VGKIESIAPTIPSAAGSKRWSEKFESCVKPTSFRD
jgi:hypothetical protein